MKILLMGATGAVGRLLLPLLIEAGHEVTATTRSASKREQIAALGGQPMVVDALDREGVFTAVNTTSPDVIIHQLTDLAGRDFAANSHLRVVGTRNLVDAALAAGVQRMIAQSIAWMYVPGEGPAREDEPLDLDALPPRIDTVTSVQSHEQAVAEMPVGIILRYGLFYGPGAWFSRDGLTTAQIRNGEITATDGVSSFIHVADAASAALLALNWPAGIYNIVDDEPAIGTEWVSHYASLVGASPPPVKLGKEAWERGASNAKARQLGWQPQYSSWRTGFETVLR